MNTRKRSHPDDLDEQSQPVAFLTNRPDEVGGCVINVLANIPIHPPKDTSKASPKEDELVHEHGTRANVKKIDKIKKRKITKTALEAAVDKVLARTAVPAVTPKRPVTRSMTKAAKPPKASSIPSTPSTAPPPDDPVQQALRQLPQEQYDEHGRQLGDGRPRPPQLRPVVLPDPRPPQLRPVVLPDTPPDSEQFPPDEPQLDFDPRPLEQPEPLVLDVDDEVLADREELGTEEEEDVETEVTDVESLEIQAKIYSQGCVNLEIIRYAQSIDPELAHFIEELKSGKDNIPFTLKKEVLFRLTSDGTYKMCIPQKLLPCIFFNTHYTRDGAHRSYLQITQDLGRHYYLKNMSTIFKRLTDDCAHCQMSKSTNVPLHEIKTTLQARHPRVIWSFDILSGIGKATDGCQYVYLFADILTQYTILVKAKDKTTESIMKAVEQYIILPFLAPVGFRSDRESGVEKAQQFKDFAAKFNMRLLPTAPYSSQSNGYAELKIKMVKGLLRATLFKDHNKWDEHLVILSNILNSTPIRGGFSPEQMFFGFCLPNKLHPLSVSEVVDDEYDVHTFTTKMADCHESAVSRQQQRRQENEAYKNTHRRNKQFQVGQLVRLRNTIIKDKSGLVAKFSGPFMVMEISEHLHTCALESMADGRRCKAHYNHILPLKSTTFNVLLNKWDETLLEEFQ